jgi:hypothetical protein
MDKLKHIMCFIMLLIPFLGVGQKNIISGYVSDKTTGEKLIYSNVFVVGENMGTSTNEYGYFNLILSEKDSLNIVFSHIGYQSDTIRLIAIENLVLDVQLVSGTMLEEVLVTANSEMPINKRIETGIVHIPTAQIRKLPALGGESDLLKVIQLMPGVQSGSEGKSGMYVRGGTPDQNLILLDGTPLYYVNHLGGFVSAFNSDAINQAKMTKGGFPASFGGRLSSVLDVRMKDGNLNEFHGNGMLGMVTSKLALEGPIKKGKSSYLVSYRRFLYDLFLKPLTKKVMDNQQLGYHFYDFNTKINYQFSEKDQLYLSLYAGRDKIAITQYPDTEQEVDYTNSWGNNLAALRWNHVFTPKLFSNFQFAYTRYNYNVGIGRNIANDNTDGFYYNYNSGIEDLSLSANFSYKLSQKYSLKYGVFSIRHLLTPSVVSQSIQGNFISLDGDKIVAWDNAFYVENQIRLFDFLTGNIGLRYSNYFVQENSYHYIEPRLLFSINAWENSALRLAYDKMHQNVHLLSSNGVGIPVDIWFPATSKLVPETSGQVSAAFVRSLQKDKIEITAEAFYREMNHLIEYKEGYSHLSNMQNWEQNIESNGEGTAYGVEFLIHKKHGRLNGWLAYTWSKNMRQFETINFGKQYPYKYDRRHDFSLVLNYQINEEITLSANWVYGTGNAFTPPSGMYYTPLDANFLSESSIAGEEPFYNAQAYIYADRNSSRMRDYHRLDVSAQFRKEKKWGVRTWTVGIYNFYNRKNPYYYNIISEPELDIYGREIEGTNKMKIEQKSLFPFIPSVSYNFSF